MIYHGGAYAQRDEQSHATDIPKCPFILALIVTASSGISTGACSWVKGNEKSIYI